MKGRLVQAIKQVCRCFILKVRVLGWCVYMVEVGVTENETRGIILEASVL